MELRASPKLLRLLSDMLASRAGLIISVIIVFEAAKNSLREEGEAISEETKTGKKKSADHRLRKRKERNCHEVLKMCATRTKLRTSVQVKP